MNSETLTVDFQSVQAHYSWADNKQAKSKKHGATKDILPTPFAALSAAGCYLSCSLLLGGIHAHRGR
ncbi:MAG: hypothetical protein O7D34_07765 [Ignavibacteria bacterium]|nr:hypothetical protein [Ignavibacteria bacterium]